MNKYLVFFLIISLLSFNIYAQVESENQESEESKNQITVVLGYTHIPSAFEEGKLNESVFVPTIGIDYFRELNEKWFIGAVLDLELGDYIVNFNREELERESALIIGVLVGYEVAENLALMAGPAIEFEKNKNLFVIRAGTEYRFELENDWSILPSLNYDFKEEYSSWSINVGVAKKF
jgi:hypothetical protein